MTKAIKLTVLAAFILSVAAAAFGQTRVVVPLAIDKPKGRVGLATLLWVYNMGEDTVEFDTYFVGTGKSGNNPERTPNSIKAGETLLFSPLGPPVGPPDEKGYLAIEYDSSARLLHKAAIGAVLPPARVFLSGLEPPPAVDLDELDIITAADAFGAGETIVLDARTGLAEAFGINFSDKATVCVTDVYNDIGELVFPDVSHKIKSLGMSGFSNLRPLLKSLPSPVVRLHIKCDQSVYAFGISWARQIQSIAVVSPDALPLEPPPPKAWDFTKSPVENSYTVRVGRRRIEVPIFVPAGTYSELQLTMDMKWGGFSGIRSGTRIQLFNMTPARANNNFWSVGLVQLTFNRAFHIKSRPGFPWEDKKPFQEESSPSQLIKGRTYPITMTFYAYDRTELDASVVNPVVVLHDGLPIPVGGQFILRLGQDARGGDKEDTPLNTVFSNIVLRGIRAP